MVVLRNIEICSQECQDIRFSLVRRIRTGRDGMGWDGMGWDGTNRFAFDRRHLPSRHTKVKEISDDDPRVELHLQFPTTPHKS